MFFGTSDLGDQNLMFGTSAVCFSAQLTHQQVFILSLLFVEDPRLLAAVSRTRKNEVSDLNTEMSKLKKP